MRQPFMIVTPRCKCVPSPTLQSSSTLTNDSTMQRSLICAEAVTLASGSIPYFRVTTPCGRKSWQICVKASCGFFTTICGIATSGKVWLVTQADACEHCNRDRFFSLSSNVIWPGIASAKGAAPVMTSFLERENSSP